jgi:hypothetical protein
LATPVSIANGGTSAATAPAALVALGAAPLAALQLLNYVDNSGFSVNQRAYVSGTALAAAAYGHDRWKAGAGGGTYTFTQSGGPATTITITAGTLQQVVEGASVAGGNYMLSWTGTAQGRVGVGSYAASPVAVTGITAGANTTIEFNTGTLGQVKLEGGTVATPWFTLPAQQDIAKCQRFYQIGAAQIYNYVSTAGGQTSTMVGLPVLMRAAPTITVNTVANTNASGVAMNVQTGSGLLLYCNSVAVGTVNINVTFTASADL